MNVTLLLLGSASAALIERLWRISLVNMYACATLYLSMGNAAMERDKYKALISLQKSLVSCATALTAPILQALTSPMALVADVYTV